MHNLGAPDITVTSVMWDAQTAQTLNTFINTLAPYISVTSVVLDPWSEQPCRDTQNTYTNPLALDITVTSVM